MSLALSSLATMGFQAAPLVTRAAAASVSMSAIRPGARRRLHRALLLAAQRTVASQEGMCSASLPICGTAEL
jgi:hypothetical protein